jgi:hypothetical protein
MTGYDITSILDFKPPRFLCIRCRGILHGIATDWKQRTASCPVCKVEYAPDQSADYKFDDALKYLSDNKHEIRFQNIIEHSRDLATQIKSSKATKYSPAWPQMRLFFEVLSRAQAFVHFASYGLSHQLLGALKLASRVMSASTVSLRTVSSSLVGRRPAATTP